MLSLNKKRLLVSLSYLSLIFFISCTGGKGDDDNDGSGDGGNEGNTPLDLEISTSTDSNGTASINFQTSSKATKLMVSARSKGGYDLAFTEVTGGGTNYLLPNGEEVSLANSPATFINSVNIPSRAIDTQLTDATSFDVAVKVNQSDDPRKPKQ